MRRDSLRPLIYHHPEQYPSGRTPPSSSAYPSSSHNTTLPPITSLPEYARRSRASIASSSNPASCPSSPRSISSRSSRSSGRKEPSSPIDGQPLLSAMPSMTTATSAQPASTPSSYRVNQSAMSHEHSSTNDSYYSTHAHSTGSQHARSVEDGSHLWGDGMKGIWNSLTGAPHSKQRSTAAAAGTKGDHLEPARPSEVEAASSIWDIPRDTVTMTMGFQGQYEVPSLHSQPTWHQQQHHQQQQQQQQQHVSSYPNIAEDSHHAQIDHASSYSSAPAPSGMAGSAGESRSRVSSDASALADRHYARRPNYQHARPLDAQADASNGAQWWPVESHSVDEASAQGYGRRLQPPPLPETRSGPRQGWPNSSGFEIGGYEFPQSSLGKRQYEEESTGASSHGGALAEGGDGTSRRYSLASNMSFSRPSAPVGSMMNSYRPVHNDPRRPSLPSDPYNLQQPAPATQRAGYSTSSQWSPWGGAPSHAGVPAGMSTSASSPNLPGWRDHAPMRYGIEAGYPSPSGMPGSDKRQQRDRSSSSASAVQQANTLANTPYQITTDIVLRAPAGSKMEDVYYDQHCEIRTGLPDPPASDFKLENEEDRPRRQTDKLRFPGDLYTPRWVRGAGNAREAWCDRCENGNWLQLKNSQYWYDQVHKHGISSVSGLRFTAPTHLKVYADAAGTVEGKCHQCKEWVLICTAKRRRNFAAFFKHAHACHSYRKASAVGNGPYVEHNPGGHRNKKGNHSPI